MTKEPDPRLLDDLWYFDSVVSRPIKREKSKKERKPANVKPASNDEKTMPSVNESRQLPVSTDGDRALASAGLVGASSSFGVPDDGDASGCEDGSNSSSDGGTASITSELVDKMEKGTGELPLKELDLWMEKLGLEYTEDRAMIRRVPNSELSSQQKLDFSEFVCVNRFIEDSRHTHSQQETSGDFSEAHLASLHEVFDLFDRDDNGLISPAELRGALEKLGLIRNGSG